jgi:MFS-type transporter involved in bile tolerance (Atg22 family)
VPRVLNLAIAGIFLALLAPVVGAWGDLRWYAQVAVVLFGAPFLLVALMCLASAARPGSLGRAVRRARRR